MKGAFRRGLHYLDACPVLRVAHGNVPNENILDNVILPFVLAERPYGDAMRAVADQILDDHVGAVGLEGNTIVTVVDGRVLNGDAVGAVRVPPVGVLSSVYRLGRSSNVDASEEDIARVGNPMIVLRRVSQRQRADDTGLESHNADKDGAKDVYVLSVKVPPHLAVTVDDSWTIEVDIIATDLEERCGVLECLVEAILLPVIRVIGESDVAKDLWCHVSHVQGTEHTKTHEDRCGRGT